MPAAQPILEQIVAQAEQLPAEDRVRLIHRLAESLLPAPDRAQSRRMVYGEFSGPSMSTDEDFKVAEWRPSDRA